MLQNLSTRGDASVKLDPKWRAVQGHVALPCLRLRLLDAAGCFGLLSLGQEPLSLGQELLSSGPELLSPWQEPLSPGQEPLSLLASQAAVWGGHAVTTRVGFLFVSNWNKHQYTKPKRMNSKAFSAWIGGLQDCFKNDGCFKPVKDSWHICRARYNIHLNVEVGYRRS